MVHITVSILHKNQQKRKYVFVSLELQNLTNLDPCKIFSSECQSKYFFCTDLSCSTSSDINVIKNNERGNFTSKRPNEQFSKFLRINYPRIL